jgi:hypothetical protein
VERRRPSTSQARADTLRQRASALAELLDGEAFRCSRVLAMLDLKRARECSALARRSHQLADRFAGWADPSVVPDRLKDVLDYDDLLEAVRELGLQEPAL